MGQPAVTGLASGLCPKTMRPVVDIAGLRKHVSLDAGNGEQLKAASVQSFEAFADIPMADCIHITAGAHERQFPRRQTLFFEGDPARQVFLLTAGFVKVTQLGANGQEVILRLNGAGDVLGGLGAGDKGDHRSTARAVQAGCALVWEGTQFELLAERFPALRRNIARVLEQRLNELEVRFREISTQRVSQRLSSQLVRLASQVGKSADQSPVEIALSRRELAQLTGTTLFTVSRLLSQWETRGVVSARREAVLVRDVRALMQLSRAE